MPHDFGSSRDRRSAAPLGAGIGFHELRQACEISALREDLERLSHEAGALRDGVEQAVETVRDRFAALSAEEMADPMVLAPLLQLAVTTLLEIREQARQLNTRTGPLSDDDRPSWLRAADAPRLRQPAAQARNEYTDVQAESDGIGSAGATVLDATPIHSVEPLGHRRQQALAAPVPPAPPSTASGSEPSHPASHSPGNAAAPAHASDGQASWLASEPAPTPPPSRAATARANGSGLRRPGGVDWLGPAGR